jgi:enoyl-[acyl-carrier protein] reductase I
MKNGGSIVTMTYLGAEKVIPRYNVMGVAKAALESCAKYLAYEFGQNGIRINCISAGALKTLSSSAVLGIKDMIEKTGQISPLKRSLTQEDVASTALYLLSELASGVTGEVMHVDCGYNILGMFE